MSANKLSLENLLLEHGLLKPSQLEYVQDKAQRQKQTIADIIRAEQLVYPEPLAQLTAESLGLPYVDLQSVQVDQAAMTDISNRAAHTYHFIVFGQIDNKFQVAMANPADYQALEAVRFIVKKKNRTLELYCASPEGIEQALSPETQPNVNQALRDFGKDLQQSSRLPEDEDKLQQTLTEAPISKVFAVIMRHAVEGLASDVHIEPFGNDLRIRYRINGELHTSLLLSQSVHRAVVSRIKILANLQVSASSVPQEGRFTFASGQQVYSVRVAIMPTIHGEKITLHLVDTTKAAPSFSELGFIGPALTQLKEQLQDPKGLIIIAGPDGSGKSTTLNAILTALNSPATSISTVEETIEYEIPGVTQIQTNPALSITYEQVLQNLLRQDVDIIMAEEIRSAKTGHLLTKGALAGRLMISTIHAQDALRTIPQLIDLGISPYVLSSSLRLLIAQRLVPKLCQACKQPNPIPKAIHKTITQTLKQIPEPYLKAYSITSPSSFYISTGCPKCHERKTRGQIALYELVRLSKELSQSIVSAGNYDELVTIAERAGHLTLRQDGVLKALLGLVRYEDVVRVTA